MICTILSQADENDWKCRNEYEQPYIVCKMLITQKILQLYAEGFEEYYVNCEEGVPLWAAEIICHLRKTTCPRLRLHVVTPYEEQCCNWSEDMRDRYYHVHRLADSVQLLSTQFHEACYAQAQCYMTERSDLVLFCRKPEDTLLSADFSGVPVEFLVISEHIENFL